MLNTAWFVILKMKLGQIRAVHSGYRDVAWISHLLNITYAKKAMEQMLRPSTKEEPERGSGPGRIKTSVGTKP